MNPLRREFSRLTALSTPAALTQLSSILLWTVDLLMVGRVGVEALNAVSLGRIWVMGTAVCAMGLIFGRDAPASQAHGARDGERLGHVLLHASALSLLISLPLAALWFATGPVLAGFGQNPEIAAVAHRYVVVQIPALPFFLLFIALRQYLQARGIVRPAMWVSFAANGLNVLLNWLLVFGHGGLPPLGAVGAGVATALTEVFMLLALAFLMVRLRLQHGAATVLDPRRVGLRGLVEIAGLGAPVAVQIGLEYWAFAIAGLWAGRLGPVELAAHTVAINVASIAFMLPLGISFGAATRVGNLIGAGDPQGAQRAAWVSLGLGGGVMAFFAVVFIIGRSAIPAWYTPDPAVVAMSAALLPIVAAFELFDGVQAVGGGILRGMGRTRPAALFNLVGYYLLALPLAAWLGDRERLGLAGIWWGLALGLAVVALLLVSFIHRRGPATARPLPARDRAA